MKQDSLTPTKRMYWNNNGKYQKTYNRIWECLIPPSGEAGNSDAEAVRCVSRLYYDFFNNGFCNAVEDSTFTRYYLNMFNTVVRYLGLSVTPRIELEDKLLSGNDDEIEYYLELLVDDVLEKAGDNITDEEYMIGGFHKLNLSIRNISSLLTESIDADLLAEDFTRMKYCTKALIESAQAIQLRIEEVTKEKK